MNEFVFCVLPDGALCGVSSEEMAQRLAEKFEGTIYFFADVTTNYS
jgi:hypothetical protein